MTRIKCPTIDSKRPPSQLKQKADYMANEERHDRFNANWGAVQTLKSGLPSRAPYRKKKRRNMTGPRPRRTRRTQSSPRPTPTIARGPLRGTRTFCLGWPPKGKNEARLFGRADRRYKKPPRTAMGRQPQGPPTPHNASPWRRTNKRAARRLAKTAAKKRVPARLPSKWHKWATRPTGHNKLIQGRKVFGRDLYGLQTDDRLMETLETRNPPASPAQDAWDARMKDWMDGGDRILKMGQEYRRGYREKICSRCPHEQKVRRDCASLSPNCDELECAHMTRAFARKHRKDIERHLASHPLSVRLRLNAELEARRSGSGCDVA